jgi:uncharacterized protein (TIGR02246 family)
MTTLSYLSPAATVEAMDDAFNRGDVDTLLSFYAKDAVVAFEPSRKVTGHEALRSVFEHLLKLAPQARNLKAEVIESGALALYMSLWCLATPGVDGGETTRIGVATTVLRREEDGVWRVVLDNPWGPELLGLPPLNPQPIP